MMVMMMVVTDRVVVVVASAPISQIANLEHFELLHFRSSRFDQTAWSGRNRVGLVPHLDAVATAARAAGTIAVLVVVRVSGHAVLPVDGHGGGGSGTRGGRGRGQGLEGGERGGVLQNVGGVGWRGVERPD